MLIDQFPVYVLGCIAVKDSGSNPPYLITFYHCGFEEWLVLKPGLSQSSNVLFGSEAKNRVPCVNGYLKVSIESSFFEDEDLVSCITFTAPVLGGVAV